MLARWIRTTAVPLITGGLLVTMTPSPAWASTSPPQWRIAKVFPGVEQVLALSANGPRSAWATGDANGVTRLAIERWNGRSWQRISPPPTSAS